MTRLFLLLNLICFSLNSQVVKLDSSNLPICIIDTRGKTIANEPKILAHMKIIFNGPGKMNFVKDKKYNYNNFIAIEVRGNSSQSYPQKQYGIELRDSISGDDLDTSLIDMPQEEDWVLYAPYNDISMMRNVLTYHLWNEMGHWGPRTRFCELILNNEYVGIYILTESIKRDQNRVDVAKLNPEDISGQELTGGYIMKIDKRNSPTDLSFVSKIKSTTNQDITWLYHYPDAKDIKPAQQNYIRNYIDTVEQLIASPGFADPKNGYKKYLSLNSFIDYFLITELSRNIDAYKASSYFYKEKQEADGSQGMLKAGPVWDYNFAFGNASFCSGAQTNGWMYDGCMPATLPTPIIWRRLLSDSNYLNQVKCRYLELRKTIWDTNYLFKFIDHYAFDTLDAAQKRHFAKWKILGTNPGGFNAYIAASYPDEIKRLKTWIKSRLMWMDANLGGRCIPNPTIAKIEVPLDPECFNGQRPKVQKTQPFNTTPFNYQGLEKISFIPPDIIRWVLVELRDVADSSKIIDRRAALLRSDSVLVDTNFTVGVFFPKAISNLTYYLVVRYDEFSLLMSKEFVKLPNNNDYNLNRNHKVLNISKNSSILYNSKWIGVDTFYICQGQSIILNDSNLINAGYSFGTNNITISWDKTKILTTHKFEILFDTNGLFPIEVYINCNEHFVIRSLFYVNVWPNPKALILGPDALCPGDSTVFSTGKFASYKWSTGDQTQFTKIYQPGKYALTVSDDQGCISILEKEISIYPEIKGKIVSKPSDLPGFCKLVFISDDPNSKYSYLWNNGNVTDSIETNEKLVTLLVSDSNQCTSSFIYKCDPLSTTAGSYVGIQIIPNPSNGAFTVLVEEVFRNSQLTLLDLKGKIVFSKYIPISAHYINVNTNELPLGLYILRISKDNLQINKKVLILE